MHEQIAYPVHETRLDDARLRLEIHSYDAISDWCALQTRVYDEEHGRYWGCLPNTGGGGSEETGCFYFGPNGEEIAVDCVKLVCAGSCDCTETSCSASYGYVVKLDGALSDDGTKMQGTIVFDTPYTVRLTRQ